MKADRKPLSRKERAQLHRELNELGYKALAGQRTADEDERARVLMIQLGYWTNDPHTENR